LKMLIHTAWRRRPEKGRYVGGCPAIQELLQH